MLNLKGEEKWMVNNKNIQQTNSMYQEISNQMSSIKDVSWGWEFISVVEDFPTKHNALNLFLEPENRLGKKEL